MKLPGSDLVKMDAVVFVSHSTTERTTDVLLLCNYWCQASYISDMIMELAGVVTHPAAIPVLLCNLYRNVLSRRVQSTWNDLFQTEVSSGRSGIAIVQPSGAALAPGNCDDPDISRKAISVTQLAIAWDVYMSRGNSISAAVKSFLELYMESYVQPGDELLVAQSQILWNHLDVGLQRADALSYSIKHLLERAKIQVEAVRIFTDFSLPLFHADTR